jgi:hypothetical protein
VRADYVDDYLASAATVALTIFRVVKMNEHGAFACLAVDYVRRAETLDFTPECAILFQSSTACQELTTPCLTRYVGESALFVQTLVPTSGSKVPSRLCIFSVTCSVRKKQALRTIVHLVWRLQGSRAPA